MTPPRPMDPASAVSQARALIRDGHPDDAVKVLRRAGKPIERVAAAQHTLARALLRLGRFDDAARAAKRARTLDPADPEIRFDLARALSRINDFAGAAEALDAVPPGPAYTKARRMMGKALMDAGDYAQAREAMMPALESDAGGEDHVLVLGFARLALAPGNEDLRPDALARLDRFAGGRLPERAAADVHQHLARLHDALGAYDEAFRHADRFNELVRQDWDADGFSARVDDMLRAWTPEAWAGTARAPEGTGKDQILIIGMPRSGTTLVEQLFGAHPDVHPAGERPDFNEIAAAFQPPDADTKHLIDRPELFTERAVTKAGRDYAERMRRARIAAGAKRCRRTADKMPYNFLYLPLIRASMPACTIVHTRRDPLDVGISNYMHLFVGDHRFSTRLDWLGRFIADEKRLVDHLVLLPGMNVHRVSYEELAREPAEIGRAMFEAAGLDWSDQILSFHTSPGVAATASIDQVRRPVHTASVNRANNYRPHLGPLIEAMGG